MLLNGLLVALAIAISQAWKELPGFSVLCSLFLAIMWFRAGQSAKERGGVPPHWMVSALAISLYIIPTTAYLCVGMEEIFRSGLTWESFWSVDVPNSIPSIPFDFGILADPIAIPSHWVIGLGNAAVMSGLLTRDSSLQVLLFQATAGFVAGYFAHSLYGDVLTQMMDYIAVVFLITHRL